DVEIRRQKGLERDRGCGLPDPDQVCGDIEDLLMHRLEEMRGLEEVGYAVERVVVDEDGAEQRLLRLDVVRCSAIERRRRRNGLECGRFLRSHEIPPMRP